MKIIWLFFILLLFPFHILFSQSLSDSLIVHYPLDGNADDLGPNNLDGTFLATSATDCAGDTNGATYFDGINDYIALPNDPLLKPQLPVSFSFKIKIEQPLGHILSTDGFVGAYEGIWIQLNQASQYRIAVSYGDGNGVSPPNRRTIVGNTQLNQHQWYTITLVISGPQQFSLYLNCQEEIGSYSGSGGALSYSNVAGSIGRNLNGTPIYFNGYLDEFRMWNRALTPQDVEILHNSPCILSDTVTATICQGDSISIDSKTYHFSTGTYNDTLLNATALGCDSIVVLDLTVLPNKTSIINHAICDGDNFNFNGKPLSSSGTFIDTLQASNSCDSIITLNLNVKPIADTSIGRTICEGDTFDFNGDSFTTAGIYVDTVLSSSLCDSIITLDLSVLPRSFTSLNEEICDGGSFNFNGNILTFAGTYMDTLSAANGCDSIITLNLTVLPRSFTPLQADICQGDTFDFNGSKLATTGIYTDTLVAANLCDSIVTLDLNVKPLSDSTLNISICEGDFYFFDGNNLNSSGTYMDTLQASNSCDSVITLNLTAHPIKFDTLDQTICEGDIFNFNGTPITNPGIYVDTLLSSTSCDSIITLDLSVLPRSFTSLNEEICDGESFNFNGNTLTFAGTYIDTLSAANGCDSIITLNLTVLPRSFNPLQADICQGDTFDFNGSKLATTGIYTDTLVAANLCDSIVTLDLKIKPLSYTSITDSIFSNGSYNFNGTDYTEVGIYFDTLSASNGCDSIIALNLSIRYPRGSINMGICPGDTVLLNDSSYFEAGLYIDTLYGAASNGADSLLYISIVDLSIEECYPISLKIPNIFTPNNDGVNDEFMVIGENITYYKIDIFNRWGKLVYTSENINRSWDGRLNGNRSVTGSYFYIIEYQGINGEKHFKKGTILIKQ